MSWTRGPTGPTRITGTSGPSCFFFFHRNGRFALTQPLHYHSRGRVFIAVHGRFYDQIIRGPETCEPDHGCSHECFNSCSGNPIHSFGPACGKYSFKGSSIRCLTPSPYMMERIQTSLSHGLSSCKTLAE